MISYSPLAQHDRKFSHFATSRSICISVGWVRGSKLTKLTLSSIFPFPLSTSCPFFLFSGGYFLTWDSSLISSLLSFFYLSFCPSYIVRFCFLSSLVTRTLFLLWFLFICSFISLAIDICLYISRHAFTAFLLFFSLRTWMNEWMNEYVHTFCPEKHQ